MEKKLQLIGEELGMPDFRSKVKDAFTKKEQLLNSNDTQKWLILSDGELDFYAQKIIDSTGLPIERKVNILKDMKNRRYFYNSRKSDSLELVEDIRHSEYLATLYAFEPKYLVECAKCGVTTNYDSNVDNLLLLSNDHTC